MQAGIGGAVSGAMLGGPSGAVIGGIASMAASAAGGAADVILNEQLRNEALDYKHDMFGYTWIKAFRKDAIGKNRFPTDLNLLEDEVFACNVLSKKRKIGVLPKAIINYVTGNNQSLIGKTHQDYCKKVDAAYKAWKELLNSCDNKKEILTEMANSHVSRCMYYGFEREVKVKDFFAIMKNCEFFADSNINNAFALSVKDGKYKKLLWMRNMYCLKVFVAKIIKKDRGI